MAASSGNNDPPDRRRPPVPPIPDDEVPTVELRPEELFEPTDDDRQKTSTPGERSTHERGRTSGDA